MTVGDQSDHFDLAMCSEPGCLVARISGHVTTAQTLTGVFAAIAEQHAVTREPRLLVLDGSDGPPPPPEDIELVATALRGAGLDDVRIAFVETTGLHSERLELGEFVARRHGYTLSAFSEESRARLWLWHGLDQPD